ncbi:hypothetical protein [Candidatus Dactylopiibacterium carminicum]|uniref:hypothetical protein n=1 Tax=Candidatus Dactylopiibacterium carminicum TaxID=857335 RepID=UPI001CC2FC05|nr:hypothetical protein [Candidatus Dactylopiibacterium carminicum]
MPTGQASTAPQKSAVAKQSTPKRAREQRFDDGSTILPNMEHFVGLLRKLKRPGLAMRLLEQASGAALPELHALADAAKGKLPVESRQAIFHAVTKLEVTAQQNIERAAERVMLLEDDYGAQAVQSLLDEQRTDDAAVLAMPSDRYSRALYLCILQEFPENGARREDRFDQAEHPPASDASSVEERPLLQPLPRPQGRAAEDGHGRAGGAAHADRRSVSAGAEGSNPD